MTQTLEFDAAKQAQRRAREIVRAEAAAARRAWASEQRAAGRTIRSVRAELRASEREARANCQAAARTVTQLLLLHVAAEAISAFDARVEEARAAGAIVANPTAWLC